MRKIFLLNIKDYSIFYTGEISENMYKTVQKIVECIDLVPGDNDCSIFFKRFQQMVLAVCHVRITKINVEHIFEKSQY